MFRMLTMMFTLLLFTATAADARTVWRGRDGKTYDSVKDCFTHNPQCLPETAFVAGTPGGGTPPEKPGTPASDARTVHPRDAASGLSTGRQPTP